MIFINLIRYLLGYVRFKIISDYPEKALNIIKNAGINIWNIRKKNKIIEANVNFRDYKKLKTIIGDKFAKVETQQKRGYVFKINTYKNRTGMIVGFVMFFTLLSIMPNYIWNVNVSGNNKLEEETILSALTELGVYEGTKISKIDSKKLVSQLRLKLSDISWAAINIEGAVANVEITERVIANVESTEPSNLISLQDGCVVGIKVLGGNTCVKLGDTVRKGDLLVSGITQYKNGKQDFVRSHGEIICRTRENIIVNIPLKQKNVLMTEKIKKKSVLHTPFFDIPLFLDAVKFDFQKTKNYNIIELNNNYIPIYLISAKFYETKESIIEIDEKTALALAENELKIKEKEMLSGGKIIAKESKITKNKNNLQLKAEYLCEKNIAFEEKIILGTVN